jgi:hypothetical protein
MGLTGGAYAKNPYGNDLTLSPLDSQVVCGESACGRRVAFVSLLCAQSVAM